MIVFMLGEGIGKAVGGLVWASVIGLGVEIELLVPRVDGVPGCGHFRWGDEAHERVGFVSSTVELGESDRGHMWVGWTVRGKEDEWVGLLIPSSKTGVILYH